TSLCDLLVSTCTDGDIRASVHFGSTLLLVDVTGYFAPPADGGPLAPTVDWANVTNKPLGFADGIDNVGVTSVTASGPLSSSGGDTPNISLTGIVPVANGGTGASSVATSPFLTKTIGTCAVGSTIQSINSDGTVVCAATQDQPGFSLSTIDSPG